MGSRTFMLLVGGNAPWRVAVDARVSEVPAAPAAPAEPIERLAAAAAESLRRAGCRREPVLLAIPSAWCVAAAIALDGLPRRRDRAARLYRLEEKLPLAAEDFVADFADVDGRALGVAARVEQLRPVVDALESAGVAVESIVPTALLAAQASGARAGAHVLCINDGDVVDVLTLRDHRPVAWSVAPASPEEVELHVKLALHAAGVAGAAEVVRTDEPAHAAAARAGRDVLRGRIAPWIDLRRDALASPDRIRPLRRALDAALASAALLLIALSAVMLVRASRFEAAARGDERQLVDRFTAEFPGWATPANVGAVIDSEHRKLATLQAGAARQASAESALRLLVRVLSALPPGARVAIEQMTFDDRGFVLDGRVAAPAELDAITASMGAANLRIAAPQAHRDDGGGAGTWRFTLRGEVRGELPAGTAPRASSGSTPLAEARR